MDIRNKIITGDMTAIDFNVPQYVKRHKGDRKRFSKLARIRLNRMDRTEVEMRTEYIDGVEYPGTDTQKIYIDFDGTIADSMKRLVEILNGRYGTTYHHTELKKWNCTDLFPDITQSEITGIFESDEFYNGLEICEGFDLTDYTIVTIGTAENLRKKKEWCDANLTEFEFIGLEKTEMGKSEVDMSDGILIDDVTHNLDSCNASETILYQPYEAEWNAIPDEEDHKYWVCEDWKSVKNIIEFVR